MVMPIERQCIKCKQAYLGSDFIEPLPICPDCKIKGNDMCKCNPASRTPYCGKPGCEWPEQVTTVLHKMLVKSFRVETWTNEHLADWLLETIWGEYNIDSDESAIIGEIIERLRKMKKP